MTGYSSAGFFYGVAPFVGLLVDNLSFDGGSTYNQTDGMIWIGSSSGSPVPANLTVAGGLTITNGANTIDLGFDLSDVTWPYTNVNTTPYTVLDTDLYLSVDSSGGAITLNFPNAPLAGSSWLVKDRTGSAATFNITLTTPGGIATFDGQTHIIGDSPYFSLQVIFNGSDYELFGAYQGKGVAGKVLTENAGATMATYQ